MIARLSGACLGLLAFAVTAVAGLMTHLPVDVAISRSVFALFLFFALGFVLGGVAQHVITEYEREGQARIGHQDNDKGAATDGGASESSPQPPPPAEAEPQAT